MAQWLRSLVLISGAAVLGLAHPAPAQPPVNTKDLIDPSKASHDKVEIWSEARELLEKELEIARGLNGLKGTVNATWTMDVEGRPPTRIEYVTDYVVSKPNKLYIDNKTYRVYVDGTTVTVANKFTNQYVQRPMPELWLLRDTLEDMTDKQILGFPGEPVLRPGMSLEQTLRGIRSVERVRTGEYEGKIGTWVSGTAIDERQPGAIPYTFERWYSDEDHLPHVVKESWTAMYQDLADKQAVEDSEGQAAPKKADRYTRVEWTKSHTRTLNPRIAADAFTFVPGPRSVKVDKFLAIYPDQASHLALHGKPAPKLVGKDFDGHDVDIAKLNGKVVVLDFWAIWCSWCVKGLPAMERIKEHYEKAGQPVVLIGVDCDNAIKDDNEHKIVGDKVKRFLARRGITIQQFDDVSRNLCSQLKVSSWPFLMIIDQNGNVADTDIGYTEGKEQELMAKIDKLLAGKPIRTPEEEDKLKQLINAVNVDK